MNQSFCEHMDENAQTNQKILSLLLGLISIIILLNKILLFLALLLCTFTVSIAVSVV